MILSCDKINKAFGSEEILKDVSFGVEEGEKTAVVGVNGAGKTTLFKIIAGEHSADGGEIYKKKDATLGYLAQNASIESDKSIYDEVLEVFAPVIRLEEDMRKTEAEMSEKTGDELQRVMNRYDELSHKFENLNGYGFKSRIKSALKGLGFAENEFEKPVSKLSGGEKTRVFLAKLLLLAPDILLLDEPTNHLDIPSVIWLEDFIRSYPKTVIVISHDRYFMNKTVRRIIEIENGKAKAYDGSYADYAQKKQADREIQLRQYLNQQKEIKRQQEIIKTLKSFNREKSVKRAESRQKALDKVELAEKPEALPDKMRLSLKPSVISGSDVLAAETVSKGFGERTLFSNVNIDVKRGERVALIGANGVGKSTLFKIILGEKQADGGEIKFGANVNVGYYDQEQNTLKNDNTVFEEISDAYPNMKETEIRNLLAAFVFTGDDVFKKISSLSGGERGRVSLAKIMLSKANLLMLDEPTNHLDTFSKEILEDALNAYEGTVFFISHDRYFIDRVATKVLELTPNGINAYLGNYSYYTEKKAEKTPETNELTQTDDEAQSDAKQYRIKQKEEQAIKRKLQNAVNKLEKQIEEQENKIAKIDDDMANPKIASDSMRLRELFEEKTAAQEKLDALYDEWEKIQA